MNSAPGVLACQPEMGHLALGLFQDPQDWGCRVKGGWVLRGLSGLLGGVGSKTPRA